jgi:DNA-directed RNA polymerase subunit M/transcription elongation factor TFIIS
VQRGATARVGWAKRRYATQRPRRSERPASPLLKPPPLSPACRSNIISDPSLTREKSIVCPKCNGQEAIFIQAKASPSDDRMRLIFVCTNPACVYKWQG